MKYTCPKCGYVIHILSVINCPRCGYAFVKYDKSMKRLVNQVGLDDYPEFLNSRQKLRDRTLD